ncbi:MAG: C4-dicarboxylate TRAP transporter substrate-binding protein [Rhizobiaceae bacterium]|nr:C4-dicarboxylate TRAP transporter substrate-binding protein [Rhizobiaceae bacterium]|tara:strand:- start:2332 stop:3411 length:1080 start_codon:yes stop_codon:yes gene_type:complete
MKQLKKYLATAAITTGLLAMGTYSTLADNITLRVGAGHPLGPTVYVDVVHDFFVPEVTRRVAEETDHTINFVEAYGGTIAGVAETLEAVQSGLLDIGAYCFCFEPAKLFLHNFPYYAPFGPQDSVQSMEIARKVYDRVPALEKIFVDDYGQMLLGLSGWDNYHLGTKETWETVDDLKDVKIGGAGPNLPWLKYVGAVPVQSTLPEGYLSLSTGVYDGWLMFPSAYYGFKFYEPAPVYTLIGFGPMAVIGLTMGVKSFNRLPEDVQKIILEVGREYEVNSGIANNARQIVGLEKLKEAGATLQAISEETRTAWAKSLANFPSEQAKEAEGRGLPGLEVMRAYIDEVEKSDAVWSYPYKVE